MNLRRKAALAGAGLLAIAGVTLPVTAAHAAASCEVTYTANPWTEGPSSGGFTANITVKNTGDAWTTWTLTFALPAGQTFGNGWSANWTTSGQNVTATPLDWNKNLGTGASTGIGFNGRWTGSYSGGPSSFAVNGVACNGQPPVNQLPSVSLTSPTAGASFAVGTAVPLGANASDSDGTVARVDFLVDGAVVASDTSSPYTGSATGLAVGTHTAAARAVDNLGGTTTTANVSFTVTGTQTPSIVLTPAALSVAEGGSASLNVKLNAAPSGNVSVALARTGDTSITVSSPVTLTTSNWNTGVNATVSAAEDSDSVNGTATIAASATGYTGAQANVTEIDNDVIGRVDNPYVGSTGYVNPLWRANALAEPGGSRVANTPTFVWFDRISALYGNGSPTTGNMGLEAHLNEAVVQDAANGAAPLVFQMVVYNLPGRDCSALASNGELGVSELPRYKAEYIDPMAEILARPAYANLRIVATIEIDSLPNLVTNLSIAKCATMNSNGGYVNGVGYALRKLGAIPNVYNYIDSAHHGWIGWDSNFGPTAQKLFEAANAEGSTPANVHGFITNTANTSALREPYINLQGSIGGAQVRSSTWVDWNQYNDELTFAQAFRSRLVTQGFSPNIGMLIDTSRNGWGNCVVTPCAGGGATRPTAASTSTVLNTNINQSRIDRRIHKGNWCNQAGAGMGERPTAAPETGIDAYVWAKPPGESDGSSTEIPNNEGKGFDRMCDPTYTGNNLNGNNMSGSLPGAPLSGHWFSAQFQQLMANAYPPLP
ncbi:glycoside hydrolase family 6 protein [Catelliglobosispora koreensis]|uniref:glycoside hydrolase family 6 protein n=1 Tax=Catelliglobosispora koreensis TaxID=129052 RepID=UPI00036F294F|nr:glycoside hydrolase family 6 protein [Catelliglobosispora koreensis]